MKKILFAIASVAMMLMIGCKKDDGVKELSLNGTKWVSEQVWGGIKGTEALMFGDKTVTIEAKSEDGTISNKVTGTYTYNHPTVIILVTSSSGSVSMEMTVSGNNIEFRKDGRTYFYEKQ